MRILIALFVLFGLTLSAGADQRWVGKNTVLEKKIIEVDPFEITQGMKDKALTLIESKGYIEEVDAQGIVRGSSSQGRSLIELLEREGEILTYEKAYNIQHPAPEFDGKE